MTENPLFPRRLFLVALFVSLLSSCGLDSLDRLAEDGPVEEVYADLEAAGFNGVVATSHNGEINFRGHGS